MFKLKFTKQALKDSKKAFRSGFKSKINRLLDLLVEDPFVTPPRYKRLMGDMSGKYSRRINIQHRLVYKVYAKAKIVKIYRMWTHYS